MGCAKCNLIFAIFRFANGSGNFEYSFFIFYLFIPFLNVFIRNAAKEEFKKLVIYLIFVFSVPLFALICRSVLVVAGVFVCCSLIDMIRIYLIEKPVFDHFSSLETALNKIWRFFTNICCSIYGSIISLAER